MINLSNKDYYVNLIVASILSTFSSNLILEQYFSNMKPKIYYISYDNSRAFSYHTVSESNIFFGTKSFYQFSALLSHSYILFSYVAHSFKYVMLISYMNQPDN